MNFLYCPLCFDFENPEDSKVLHCEILDHLKNFHGKDKNIKDKKIQCYHEECIEKRKKNHERLGKEYKRWGTGFSPAGLYGHFRTFHKNRNNLNFQNTIAMDTDFIIENNIIQNIEDEVDETDEIEEILLNNEAEENLKYYERELHSKREINDLNELINFYKNEIFTYFNETPGAEIFFKNILTLIRRLLIVNTPKIVKDALLSIEIEDIITKAKNTVESFKIVHPDERIIFDTQTDSSETKEDKNLFYFIPIEKSLPIILRNMKAKPKKNVELIIYGDDLQGNNPLGSHIYSGSLFHMAYKVNLPNDLIASKKSSQLKNIQTIGISLSTISKETKYQYLIQTILEKIRKAKVYYNGFCLNIIIKAFIGDHSYLQDAFLLNKAYSSTSNMVCRSCKISGNSYLEYNTCSAANSHLRQESPNPIIPFPLNQYSDSFHDILEGIIPNLIYSLCQKFSFPQLTSESEENHDVLPIFWHPIELEIRRFNKLDKGSQSLSTVIFDGFFQKYTKIDRPDSKHKFHLSGSENLALARALLHCMTKKELFPNVSESVYQLGVNLLKDILAIYSIINGKIELNNEIINRMEVIIDRFFRNFFLLMPRTMCTLKLHSLLHYPVFAKLYKNLSLVSTIRCESLNRHIKYLHNLSCNHINPSYTVVKKVALLLILSSATN
ncbi:Hypothetical protein SRAE_0000048900 [Strongyloides ratti]|uniref:Uncharacterized protein n=1 Tax=Strongyloides ratti TaxID=34506 RepID=A0A090MST0_STRRB|nr:Hypothetical protein SRAE_0000048900 [Strongyloides ratti]CEF61363.1 Hypothetical protein SRAE_0000048900 [Strongyloides ratti]